MFLEDNERLLLFHQRPTPLTAESMKGFYNAGIRTVEETAKILMLSVNKNYRKSGIGSALITKFLEEMLIQNIKQVDLEVRTNNTAAINFYKKHGFDIVETIPKFYQNGEDAYIMNLVLRSN